MTGFWVKVQDIGPDIGQLRHKLDSGAPSNFVLPVRRWVNINEDKVLAMFGMAVKGDDAGGSDQAYAALKARKKKKPEDVEKLLALVADIVVKAKVYCELQAKQQPLKWAVADREPRAEEPAKPAGMLDRLKTKPGK